MECTCSVCVDACDVFGGTAVPIVQFIRACDFVNVYPTNSKFDLSLCTDAQIIAMSCICVLCVDQLPSVCVHDLCL